MLSGQLATIQAMRVALVARVPVLLWGAPGTGKTSTTRALAAAMGIPCETVIASIREPSDFAGLPVVDGVSVLFAPPRWAEQLTAAGRGVLFLDEISTAPPAVQAALLRVVLERTVGDLQLPDDVVVGCGPDVRSRAASLSSPLGGPVWIPARGSPSPDGRASARPTARPT
jgi:MoxR-like ATPase